MRGEPMAHALSSIRQLISSLSADDRFSLIGYSSLAHTAIPLGPANAENRARWISVLGRIAPNGGTNMSAGIDRATAVVAELRQPGRTPRVILMSDGHANEGDSSFRGLVERASRAIEDEYVLSSVGVGHGFDEQLMTALADAGSGNFYYVQRSDELGEIFAGEFAAARENMASGLEVEISAAPGVEVISAAGLPPRANGRSRLVPSWRALRRAGAPHLGLDARARTRCEPERRRHACTRPVRSLLQPRWTHARPAVQ